ncbi:unnamed protein product [Brassica napus]|uniref:(rape) hypothetical protein n=1 Tax=Brassica napus TaxID=3708 RepID=A0A816XQV9_BRANA|nr:unnamed protein product [Brassica napus]
MSTLSSTETMSEQCPFDDGVYDCVKKVIIGEDSQGVAYITIQYVRNGDVVQLEHGSERGTQITETEFEVKDPDEYITCIEGTWGEANRYDSDIHMWNQTLSRTVTELQFKTSHGRTSQKFGKPGADSFEFKLEGNNGTKLVGLLGSSGRFLDEIEANFDVVSSALKQLEPQGGSDGHSWDDGAYDGLRKVCIGEDGGRVSSVEFVYAKGDQRITHCHGMDSNERKEFELEYEDGEYIISVEGTIDDDGFVSSLIFNTSMTRSSEEFGKAVANNKFFLKPIGFHKLVGFRGRSCVDRINALGANFAVVVAPPVKKLQAQGTNSGEEWDDGIHDNVRMIIVSYGHESVLSVTFEYANGTETVVGDARGDVDEIGDRKEFKLCDNNEYITSVEGFFGEKLLTSETADEYESIYYKMKRLDFITNITAYSVLENDPIPTLSEQYHPFDDGVYDCVKKVIIGEDTQGIAYITIQYVRNGDVVQLEHGSERGAQITETEFEVKDPDEYITCIEGTCGEANFCDSPIALWTEKFYHTVSEIQFTTSHGRTSPKIGCKPEADSFTFKLKGKNGTKLVGLHGKSGRFLEALKAYFVVVSSTLKQLEPQGRSDGHSWDDGAYDGLRKVCIGEDGGRVSSVEFVYAKGNECITHCHGRHSNERKQFELRYEDGEYIISFEGTTDKDGYISSLIFNTSMDRSSDEFGKAVANNEFFLKPRGFHKLVGFRGRSCVDRINALGANFAVVLAPPVKKLQAQGTNDQGEEWDDGVHDNVRMITVTYVYDCVVSVTFEYANGAETVLGDPHGILDDRHEKKEFKLCDNNEYITSVEGFFGQKWISTQSAGDEFKSIYYNMKRLDFNTNIRTYSVMENNTRDGYLAVVPFKLEEKGHKIVGFRGKSTEFSLQQIGVYVKPIDDAN